MGPKHFGVTTLTFIGHVTSSVTWPLHSPYPISYSCAIVTKPISSALFDILGPKCYCVTTLTFLGHVTSSVTWPFDSPYPMYCIGQTKTTVLETLVTMSKRLGIFQPNFTSLLYVPIHARLRIFLFNCLQLWRSYAILNVTTHFTSCVQNVHHRPKRTLAFSDILSKQLGIFRSNFTRLLNVHMYAILQIFIQLSPTMTKLCHINVKKLKFNHVLTTTCIDWHIENSKNDKKVILATITSTKFQCAGV